MAFSKSFPKTGEKYPVWEEVFLSNEEEKDVEQKAREFNKKLMEECLSDAKSIVLKSNLEPFQDVIARVAVALFSKRASHDVYWKERLCRDKFDAKQS